MAHRSNIHEAVGLATADCSAEPVAAALGGQRTLTDGHSVEKLRSMKMPPFLSYGALLALELGYTLFVFDPASTKVQAGLMLIFALEVAFAVRIAKAQLYLKQVDQSLLIRSRTCAAIYVIGMVVAMVIGLGMFPFSGVRWVMGAAFLAVAAAKIVWEHHFGRFVASAPVSNRLTR